MLPVPAHLDFAAIRQTHLEAWPEALRQLSIRQTSLMLSLAECKALGSHLPRYRSWFSQTPNLPLTSLSRRLQEIFGDYPEGAVVRLGSRSAKDSPFAKRYGLRVFCAKDALELLTSGSRRLALDLKHHLDHLQLPYLFVRAWQAMPAWSEFRCFIDEGRLVGISQYDTRNELPFPEVTTQREAIERALRSFCERLRAVLHLKRVVADVFLVVKQGKWVPGQGVRLLELNPFFYRTDPGLFSWDQTGDFDGRFRFQRT